MEEVKDPERVLVNVASILFVMAVEGVVGRSNCLYMATATISPLFILIDLVRTAHPRVFDVERKKEVVYSLLLVVRFFSTPIYSLVYNMTLNVYPTSLRSVSSSTNSAFSSIKVWINQ